MKRQIVLDTETTGLNPKLGNRVIEIGCVELIERKLTGNNFHRYLNPGRESEEGALAVHGLTAAFLSDKPKFADIASEFLAYISGAELVIHNAPFDVGFLNAELAALQLPAFTEHVDSVTDTLMQAKELHPGKRNSLDALCTRYSVSNSHRTLHGALLDAALLAEVFLAMSRGQNGFFIDVEVEATVSSTQAIPELPFSVDIFVLAAEPCALEAHESLLNVLDKEIRGTSLWRLHASVCAEAPL